MVEPSPDDGYYTSEPHPEWYHLDCFKKALVELDASDVAADHIPGFKALKKPDQKLLVETFGESGMTSAAGWVVQFGRGQWQSLTEGRDVKKAVTSVACINS